MGVTTDGYAVDLHVKVLDEGVVARAKDHGLDALVYAPHFTRLPTIQKRARQFSDDELTVFPARELFCNSWQKRRHLLAVGLEEPVPDFLTLSGTIRELQRQDAAVLVPHPGFLSVSLGLAEVEHHRDALDAIEVYNPKHLPHHNRRARRFAEKTGLPAFTSSYAHLRKTVGEAWVEFERPLDDLETFVDALQAGEPRRVLHRNGLRHQARCALEFAHLGYENTWQKFDRVMLQGTAATHPDHVAYGGDFDDVKVY